MSCWRLFDQFKEGAASWWKAELGDGYSSAKKFLVARNELVRAYPCPDYSETGCAYEIIDHGKGVIVGVCQESGCERKPFKRADLVCLRLDAKALAAALADALEIEPQVEPVSELPQAWLAGHYHPTAGHRYPVFLLLADAQDSPETIVSRLLMRQNGPSILLAPTKRGLSTIVLRSVAESCSSVVVLDENMEFADDGTLQAGDGAWVAVEAFHKKHVPQPYAPVSKTFFPTPPNAKWSDLHIQSSHCALYSHTKN